MSPSDRRERLRAVLAGERCLHPASVFDPLSARIAQDLGFELGMFAGSVASLAVLGAPDIALITLTEFAEQARRIGRAGTRLPLIVDADHGYGNALGVMRTVEELETAGVAALTIEDTALPQPFGKTGVQLTSIEEGVGKMRAALAARVDPALAILGRTSALTVTGVDDAISRLRAYEAAGVDALFVVGVRTGEQLDAIASAVRLPIVLGGVAPEVGDAGQLARRRVRISLQGHQPFMAAVGAVHASLKALREGTPPQKLTHLPPPDLVKGASREADYATWSNAFLVSGPQG